MRRAPPTRGCLDPHGRMRARCRGAGGVQAFGPRTRHPAAASAQPRGVDAARAQFFRSTKAGRPRVGGCATAQPAVARHPYGVRASAPCAQLGTGARSPAPSRRAATAPGRFEAGTCGRIQDRFQRPSMRSSVVGRKEGRGLGVAHPEAWLVLPAILAKMREQEGRSDAVDVPAPQQFSTVPRPSPSRDALAFDVASQGIENC